MLFSSCLRFICVLLVFFLFSSTAYGEIPPPGVYTYQEIVGEKSFPFFWEVTREGLFLIVSVYEKDKSFINTCSTDGATWRWQLQDGTRHNLVIDRQGDVLKISGIRDGSAYQESVGIDERPWYQPLSFSLQGFLVSDLQTMSFWTIRADTIEVVAMQVKKKGEEELFLNGLPVMAQKVEIRADGFYAHFWHGTYWFRKSDKLFLRYQSVHGSPGTAETIVELVRLPGLQN